MLICRIALCGINRKLIGFHFYPFSFPEMTYPLDQLTEANRLTGFALWEMPRSLRPKPEG